MINWRTLLSPWSSIAMIIIMLPTKRHTFAVILDRTKANKCLMFLIRTFTTVSCLMSQLTSGHPQKPVRARHSAKKKLISLVACDITRISYIIGWQHVNVEGSKFTHLISNTVVCSDKMEKEGAIGIRIMHGVAGNSKNITRCDITLARGWWPNHIHIFTRGKAEGDNSCEVFTRVT